jgi:hypothetical protein
MREQHQSRRCTLEPEIHNSNVSNKPLGQSLGSKVNQKSKTDAQTQHESYLINQEQVLKRTKS